MKVAALLVSSILITNLSQIRRGGQVAESVPEGWSMQGSHPDDYTTGVTDVESQSGARSAFLTWVGTEVRGFGTLMQMQAFDASPLRGHRLKMTAYVKSDEVTVRAGLWMRFDDAEGRMLALENMEQDPILGTSDWQRYEINLPVPEESVRLAFGVLLVGPGTVYVDDFQFEALDEKGVQNQRAMVLLRSLPKNLGFEQ